MGGPGKPDDASRRRWCLMAGLSAARMAKEAALAAEASPRIDAILAALPGDQGAVLADLRATIAEAAPDALDAFSYGAPAFRYRGRPLVAYAASKAHCSFYPLSPDVIDTHRDRLTGYELEKGTIRFTPAHPIPKDVIVSIVRARMDDIDGGGTSSGGSG